MVLVVLRAGGARMVRKDAHSCSDREVGKILAGTRAYREGSVLLARVDDDQVVRLDGVTDAIAGRERDHAPSVARLEALTPGPSG